MIDASKGFIKDGNKNRLREQDIHKIVDTFTRQAELPRYSRMVPLSEIGDAKNDFNLNLPRYIDASEPEDLQSIDGHLRGGIPNRDLDELDRYWQVFPSVRAALFKRGDRAGYSELRVAAADLKKTIFGHAEFTEWSERAQKLFAKWRKKSTPLLVGITKGDKPKALIESLSEDLLDTFEKAPLLDAYDVYQHLLDYWAATMQDDVYLLVSDGWREAAKPRLLVQDKKDKDQKKDKPDFTVGKQGFKAELIPPSLIIARYFAAEQAAIDELEAEAASCAQSIEELVEEHGGDEGLLEEAKNDKDKVTKASVAARLKVVAPRSRGRGRAQGAGGVSRTQRAGSRNQREDQDHAGDADHQAGRQVRQAERGRNQGPGRGRQVARHHRRRGPRRDRPRLADPHRPRPRAGRPLRHAAARLGGRGRRPNKQGGRALEEDGVHAMTCQLGQQPAVPLPRFHSSPLPFGERPAREARRVRGETATSSWSPLTLSLSPVRTRGEGIGIAAGPATARASS
jgi:hypothetical protein